MKIFEIDFIFWQSERSDDGGVVGDGGGDGNGSGLIVNSNDSTNNNMDVIFLGTNGNVNRASMNIGNPNKYSSCKTFQRKLELKVERAKRNYIQHNQNEVTRV